MSKAPHAVILDDHQLFTDSFSLVLEKYNLFEYIHAFTSISDFSKFLTHESRQDVYFFLDYYLHHTTGLCLVPEIKRLHKKSHIIFITSATSPSVIRNILLSRPDAILSKSCDIPTLISCIERVMANELFVDTSFQKLLEEHQIDTFNFSPRELELLKYFAAGLSIAETANKVSLSKHTIIAHRRKMMARANCHSIGQLVRYAQDHELI